MSKVDELKVRNKRFKDLLNEVDTYNELLNYSIEIDKKLKQMENRSSPIVNKYNKL